MMSNLPPRELLDEMHTFPGRFVFKAIGKTEDDFAARVVSVVRMVLAQDFDPPFELRETPGGRHVSVTVEPWVESSEQVINVFDAIRQLEGLVMLM
jgi:putative lipoic acid-binding regulatory protein